MQGNKAKRNSESIDPLAEDSTCRRLDSLCTLLLFYFKIFSFFFDSYVTCSYKIKKRQKTEGGNKNVYTCAIAAQSVLQVRQTNGSNGTERDRVSTRIAIANNCESCRAYLLAGGNL